MATSPTHNMAAPATAPVRAMPAKRRPGTLAKAACEGCRKLKMRCIITADDIPCVRCAKGRKVCIHRTSKQASATLGPTPPVTPLEGSASTDILSNVYSCVSSHGRPQLTARTVSTPSLLASVSTPRVISPISPTQGQRPASPCSISAAFTTPNPLGIHFGQFHSTPSLASCDKPGNPLLSPSSDSDDDPISREELRHLGRFFAINLLSQVPVMTEDDVRDLSSVITQRSALALSMAYVAANFVPGCKAIRARLVPAVVAIATLQPDSDNAPSKTDEDHWTTLQALAVLLTWTPSQTGRYSLDLTRDMLIMSIEALAAQHSLHKAAQSMAELLKHAPLETVYHTFTLRKYIYWLWLFTEAHFRSIISRTPPSTREDVSITRANDILGKLLPNPLVRRMIGRVELCLLWVRAELRDRDFGEWYCSTPNDLTAEDVLAVLGETDDNLRDWNLQWQSSQFQPHSDALSESVLGLQQHFMLFCNALFSAQTFQASSLADDARPSVQAFELQALERAFQVCTFFRELNAPAKAAIGYSPDLVFAMVGFCCDYIMHMHEARKDTDHVWLGRENIVVDVAELMTDIGTDDLHCSRLVGKRIMNTYHEIKTRNPQSFIQDRDKTLYAGLEKTCQRPVSHQRCRSASTLEFASSYGTESSYDSNNTSGGSSISHSPRFEIVPYGSWSTTSMSLHNIDVPHTDFTDTSPGAIMPMPTDDDLVFRGEGFTTGAMWMNDQMLSTPAAFF